jgi:hypothetical protein
VRRMALALSDSCSHVIERFTWRSQGDDECSSMGCLYIVEVYTNITVLRQPLHFQIPVASRFTLSLPQTADAKHQQCSAQHSSVELKMLTLASILRMLSNFDFLDLLPKGGTISNTVFTSNVNLSKSEFPCSYSRDSQLKL